MRSRRFPVSALVVLLALAAGAAWAQSGHWQPLERIDVQPGGAASATRFALAEASISDDGRWVVFSSSAADLVAGDSNAQSDVFVRDRRNASTRRLSLRADGSQALLPSYRAQATADGRFVTFVSNDSLLVGNDQNSAADQFLLDRDADGNGILDEPGGTTMQLVSLNNAGTTFFNGAKRVIAAIDRSGNAVTFATLQPLAGNDNNSQPDVYVRDRITATTRLISQSTDGTVGNDQSPDFFAPPLDISDSGKLVVFSSNATNLDPASPGSGLGIFLRDRDSDGNGTPDEPGGSTTRRIHVAAPGGAELPTGPFAQFDLSGDGRWMAIAASNAAGPNPVGTDIYRHDLGLDLDAPVVFVAADWRKGNANCCGNQGPRISRQGDVLAFTSTQNYNFGGVNGGRSDVFVEAGAGTLTRITDYPVPASQDDGLSYGVMALSANGAYMVVGVAGAGTSAAPAEGFFVYQRDQVFEAAFDPQP
jgi:hypothetical protein